MSALEVLKSALKQRPNERIWCVDQILNCTLMEGDFVFLCPLWLQGVQQKSATSAIGNSCACPCGADVELRNASLRIVGNVLFPQEKFRARVLQCARERMDKVARLEKDSKGGPNVAVDADDPEGPAVDGDGSVSQLNSLKCWGCWRAQNEWPVLCTWECCSPQGGALCWGCVVSRHHRADSADMQYVGDFSSSVERLATLLFFLSTVQHSLLREYAIFLSALDSLCSVFLLFLPSFRSPIFSWFAIFVMYYKFCHDFFALRVVLSCSFACPFFLVCCFFS